MYSSVSIINVEHVIILVSKKLLDNLKIQKISGPNNFANSSEKLSFVHFLNKFTG